MKRIDSFKVALVHTPCPELNDDRLEPPLGLLYIATLLRQNGIDCDICDLSGVPKNNWQVKIGYADAYGFSTYSVTYNQTLELKKLATDINSQAIMFAGGPHATALSKQCSAEFDVIVRGEAETATLALINDLRNKKDVANIIEGTPFPNLDELPFPDYNLVNLKSYNRVVESSPSISLISSRGCPHNCEHCNSRLFTRGQLRFRSPENVIAEMRKLMKQYGTTSFRFSDDLLTFSPTRVAEMTTALKPLGIQYRAFARSSSMTYEASRQLYESGCRHVAIGIESMSQRMLDLLKKEVTVQTNIDALVNAKKAGLKTRIYLLIGFPGETRQTVNESLSVVMDCDFDEFVVYPFIPYPGTSVWEDPAMWDAEIDRDFTTYVQVGRNRRTCFAVSTRDFTPEDIRAWRQMTIDKLEEKVLWAGKSPENR